MTPWWFSERSSSLWLIPSWFKSLKTFNWLKIGSLLSIRPSPFSSYWLNAVKPLLANVPSPNFVLLPNNSLPDVIAPSPSTSSTNSPSSGPTKAERSRFPSPSWSKYTPLSKSVVSIPSPSRSRIKGEPGAVGDLGNSLSRGPCKCLPSLLHSSFSSFLLALSPCIYSSMSSKMAGSQWSCIASPLSTISPIKLSRSSPNKPKAPNASVPLSCSVSFLCSILSRTLLRLSIVGLLIASSQRDINSLSSLLISFVCWFALITSLTKSSFFDMLVFPLFTL